MGQFIRILYPPIVACVRISILLFMRRLSPPPSVHFFTLSSIILNGLVAIICICLLNSGWRGQSKSAEDEVELEVRNRDQEVQRWREEQPRTRRTHGTEPLYGYPGYPRSLTETKAGHGAVSLVTHSPPTQEQQQRRESEHSNQKRENTNSVTNLVLQPEQQQRRRRRCRYRCCARDGTSVRDTTHAQ
jgi:hypothetical protein